MAFKAENDMDLEILKRISRDKLIRILEEAPGPKELIIDGDLMKLLDRIADAKILRTHGVGRMFRFEKVPPPVSASQLVYILRPSLTNVKQMADHIHSLKVEETNLQFHLICVPRIISWVTLLIEREGLFGFVIIHEFIPDFIQLDEDLLSLEMHNFYRNAFLEGDFSECFSIAKALSTMESLYGRFSNVFAHGRAAQAVVKALQMIHDDHSSIRAKMETKISQQPAIEHLFVFDRDADPVAPLLTQLTYEGALDEAFGVHAGVVELPKDVVGADGGPTKVALSSSNDPVFDSIRGRHFGGVSSHLVRKTREVQARRQATSAMSAAQMKQFVTSDLRSLQTLQKSLSVHVAACEGVTRVARKDLNAQLVTEHGLVTGAVGVTEARAFVENLVARQAPSTAALRLLCLLSLTQQGIPRKEYEALAEQVIAAYGHRHLLSLSRLRKVGLLQTAEAGEEGGRRGQVLRQVASSLGVGGRPGHWRALVRKLGLIPDPEASIDLHDPTHMSYVFNGAYTPAVPQIVANALARGPASIADALRLVPGYSSAFSNLAEGAETSTGGVVLVLLLGGITYAEVAALRLLATSRGARIVVASTSTVTGSSLVRSVV